MRHVLMYQSAFPILVPGNGSAGEGRIAMRPAASDIYGFGGGGPIALRPDIIDRLDPRHLACRLSPGASLRPGRQGRDGAGRGDADHRTGATIMAVPAIAGCPLPSGESRREDGGTRATVAFASAPPRLLDCSTARLLIIQTPSPAPNSPTPKTQDLKPKTQHPISRTLPP
jgi:hypothetical protein